MLRRFVIIISVIGLVLLLLALLAVGVFQILDGDYGTQLSQSSGFTSLSQVFATLSSALSLPLKLIFSVVVIVAAAILASYSGRMASWILRTTRLGQTPAASTRLDAETDVATQEEFDRQRGETLHQLVANLIAMAIFSAALVIVLGQFLDSATFVIVATVLANAFGFAARDFIGDLLNGISNIFEDRFELGENIQVVRADDDVRGVIERVSVRSVSLRTRSGDLIIVPQGEMRVVRNYSRGDYSGTDVTVHVRSIDYPRALKLLNELGERAPELLPELAEPWKVISAGGEIGAVPELRLIAKAQYGQGADLRLKIMSLVQETFAREALDLTE